MPQIVTADEAVSKIPDGATVLVVPMPSEEVYPAFYRVFEQTGSPKDLTLIWAAGLGPFSTERKGMNHFGYPGLMKRVIGAHFGLNHEVIKMIAMNQVEAYNLPQGVMCRLYREIAAGGPGLVSKVGLHTFVDPRIEGGKMNERTQQCEDIVEVVELNGQEMLFYKGFKPDVGIVRGTTADPMGNITFEDEAICMENLEGAMAVKNSGGFVIAQVARLSDQLASPQAVKIPWLFVDYIVVASTPEAHPHTLFVQRDPSYTGEERVDLNQEIEPMPMSWEKVICRRAALELKPGMVTNLGVGVPTGVAQVAFEEGWLESIVLNTEVGVLGGLPQGGKNFGPAKNPVAFISQAAMFDFYDGGGLDATFVGMAQVDAEGNVNVSKLGPVAIGCGGFIDITQNAKKVTFCGEFRAKGTKVTISENGLRIDQEGAVAKFVEKVDQITFSGKQAVKTGNKVLYVTERCVFELTADGLLLTEIAPGIDVERDILAQMAFRPKVADPLKTMDSRIFRDQPMSIAG